MSPLALHIFTLSIFAIYGNEIAPKNSCGDGLNQMNVFSENDGDIKIISSDDNTTVIEDKRTVKKPIFTSTKSPMTFKPIPTDPNNSSETTIATIEEIVPVTLPSEVVLPPPASTIEPHGSVTICGKMGNCYQWFDDQWALELSGYKRCEPRDERRAKRYCCIPPKLAL